MQPDFDLHVHTFHSPCGWDEMLPSEIVRLAVRRGMKTIGITDHWYDFTDPGIFDDVRFAVEEAKKRQGVDLEVFYGCEAEIMAPGRTSGSPELHDRLDFVAVGATHFMNKPMTVLPDGDDESKARHYVKMFEYAVSLPWVDVLAHPFHVSPTVCSSSILSFIKDADLLPGIELARENNIAMEISRRVFHTPEQYPFSLNFYRLCQRVGLRFTSGSDSHQLKDLAQMHIVGPVIRELALTEADFWLPRVRVTSDA